MSMFVDDTSVFISKNNYDDFKELFNLVLSHISKWFHANKLILNVEKTNIVRFTSKLSYYPLGLYMQVNFLLK
jgi:hypothetical protein